MVERTENQAALTPMSDHVEGFWRQLETETVRVLVNLQRDYGTGIYWDSSSYPDDVAKAIVAERSAAHRRIEELTRALTEARQYVEQIVTDQFQDIDGSIDVLPRIDAILASKQAPDDYAPTAETITPAVEIKAGDSPAMSARDVIEMALNTAGLDNVRDDDAPHIIDALDAAGYRLLAPGEMDAATIEACVKEVQKAGNTWSGSRDLEVALQEAAVDEKCEEIATALRNLRGTNG